VDMLPDEARSRVAIACMKATSMYEQLRLLRKLLVKRGVYPVVKTYITLWEVMSRMYDAYMWMWVLNPTWVMDHAPVFIEAKQATRGRAVYYVTIEGIPYPILARSYGTKYIEFTANSHFTRRCLEMVGLKVVDVVHHAIDVDEASRARRLGERLYEKVHKDYGGRVVFCYVGRDDHRKQLDRLMRAVDILNQKARDKYVLLMHVEVRRPKLFQRPNVYVVGRFGELPHDKVMAFYYACDFMVFPSVCEGFGVPVLECMAMGRPVVHCWYPPLSEFSLKEYNVTFDYRDVEYWKTGAEQYFIMHMYDPEDLADAMLNAIDLKLNYPSCYEEMCFKVYEHARNWDYRRIYPRLADRLVGGGDGGACQ